jgi:hypothetical protein
MRPILFAQASVLTAAALLGAATAASAQPRTLSWPGKTPAAVGAPMVAAPPRGFSAAPAAVPPPFIASSVGPARANNRYSPRSGVARLASRTPMRPAPEFVEPSYPAPAPVPVYSSPAHTRPVYTPPVYVPSPVAVPAPARDYGPPVIPNEVKPAPQAIAPPVVEAPAAPVAVVAKPVAAAKVAKSKASTSTPAKAQPEAAPLQAATPAGDRPFIRPASPNGPRFYSVHREYGGKPDASFRSRPEGAATERLPAGFFAAAEPAAEEEEVQDDAETRAAALRAAEKATKAKGKKR